MLVAKNYKNDIAIRQGTKTAANTFPIEGPMLETLDYTIRIDSTLTFYISICISTLPTQHTSFIVIPVVPLNCTPFSIS